MNRMVVEVRSEIESCAKFLPCINELPQEVFEAEFQARLRRIEEFSQKMPEQRNKLMEHCFKTCGPELNKSMVQSQSRNKPLGYPGDYQIIDWIYTRTIVNSGGEIWDEFYHRQAAPQAVRNRKAYFIDLYGRLAAEHPGFSLLNIACGPCRDIVEAVSAHGAGETIHCVDMDGDAIAYGKGLAREAQPLRAVIDWRQANAFMFRARRTYDLVWSAGLFDYLELKAAARLLKRMWCWTSDGGRVVIGNFHPENPSRNYMEWVGDWFLIHRNEQEMTEMARLAGIPEEVLRFERDATGVQLFMTARKK